MALFTYAPNAVLDPGTGEPVLLGIGKVYLPSDTGFTSPITVTLPSGVQTTEVKVNNGGSETFSIENTMAVIWVDNENPSLTSALQPILPGVPAGGTTGQVLVKVTGTDYDVEWSDPPAGGGGGGGGSFSPPVVLQQTDPMQTVLSVQGKYGEPHNTANANLTEWRNGVESGEPGLGRLVSYINEEGFFRVQNSLNSKTLIRIRNWGTSVNAFQITNSDGSQVLANWDAVTGEITAPNIGIPIRGILNVGQQPAPGTPEGIFLRRTS